MSKFKCSRLHILSDITSNPQSKVGRRIAEQVVWLSEAKVTKKEVQSSITIITKELLRGTFSDQPNQPILLAPILRAGLAMWGAANDFFNYPETTFLMGHKEKGSDRVTVHWPKRSKVRNKSVIVLDPIIATGDTVIEVCKTLMDVSESSASIIVLSCYAAPEGIQTIIDKSSDVTVVVGCMAKTVDKNGYLIPPTNGDIGDKLFGPALSVMD